jgi:hypothetical protein
MIEPDPDLVDELVSMSMVEYDQKTRAIEDPRIRGAWLAARPKAEAFARACVVKSLRDAIAQHEQLHATAPNDTRLH